MSDGTSTFDAEVGHGDESSAVLTEPVDDAVHAQHGAWLPHALRILREEAPKVEITLSSQSSPQLALALMRGKLDVAFLRPEIQSVGLSFKFLAKEPLIAVLPAGHRLTSRKKIRPQDLTT